MVSAMNVCAFYRLSRVRRPRPDEVRAWREALGLSVTAGGQVLNLSNPSVTMRAYEREGTDRAPAPPTVAYMDALTLMTLALDAMRKGDHQKAELWMLEAVPAPIRERLYGFEQPDALATKR